MKAYVDTLTRLRSEANLRRIPDDSTALTSLTDLSTNDYLGIAARADWVSEFLHSRATLPTLFSASASRLLAAAQSDFTALEQLLSSLYGRHILLFNSGYHANTGAISALASCGHTLVVADKLVHASIIDGITLSHAPFERFRHNDMRHLERIMSRRAAEFERVIIVTESVFSMDGDTAPIGEIAAIKRRYPGTLLYVDEAHALGVCGRNGLGLAADCPDVDIIIGTLGKAAASVGAFVAAASATVRDYLVNRARSFIFSTALPPVNCAWSRFVIERMVTMDAEREQLSRLGVALQRVTGAAHTGHIQPLVTGSSESALALSARLLEHGFKVLPIRTPTVPPGTERLRFSLSPSVSMEALERLAAVIADAKGGAAL